MENTEDIFLVIASSQSWIAMLPSVQTFLQAAADISSIVGSIYLAITKLRTVRTTRALEIRPPHLGCPAQLLPPQALPTMMSALR